MINLRQQRHCFKTMSRSRYHAIEMIKIFATDVRRERRRSHVGLAGKVNEDEI